MELEEAIKVVEELINSSKLARLYEGNKYYESMEKLIHYIKEESIPKAVVEEKIEFIDEEGYWEFNTDRDSDKAKEILQKILNKGE